MGRADPTKASLVANPLVRWKGYRTMEAIVAVAAGERPLLGGSECLVLAALAPSYLLMGASEPRTRECETRRRVQTSRGRLVLQRRGRVGCGNLSAALGRHHTLAVRPADEEEYLDT